MNQHEQINLPNIQEHHRMPSIPFLTWLRRDRENQRLLWVSGILLIASFAWLKLQYPFPNFMPPDSHSYIEAATRQQTINLWPIGYSLFLRLVGFFSHSHFVLVLLQYLLLHLSILYLLFTVRYHFMPGVWAFRILLLCSLLNPLFPHISNFVSSDCLFTSLSILWLTQLIWLVHQPTLWLTAMHGLVLILAITVRHTALYYPFISILVLFFSHWATGKKWVSTAFIIVPILAWTGYNQQQYQQQTGKVQYSAFAGWQLASNALYGYAYADSIASKKVRSKYRKLHILVNKHNDSLRTLKKRPDEDVSIYYLWNDKAPLRQYQQQYTRDSTSSYFKQWASMGPLYASYGRYLIRERPGAFLQHYLWPNMKRYYSPPAGFMASYNLGRTRVPRVVTNWFGWKDNSLPARHRHIGLANYFATLFPMINLAFAGSFVVVLFITGLRNSLRYGNGILWWVGITWFSNMAFSVFSAPIELRYQLFPMVFTLTFAVLQFDLLLREQLFSHQPSAPTIHAAVDPSDISIAFNYSSKQKI